MKKQSKLMPAVLSLSICFVVSSVAFADVSSFTMEGAKQISEKYLPSGSNFLYGENDYLEYELKFYNQSVLETYEIDVNKQSQEVTKFESEKQNHAGSIEVHLTDSEIKAIVEKELGADTVFSTFIDIDDGLKKYNALFIKENYLGKFEIHPENGTILERTIKQINPSYQKGNSLTIARVKELAEQKVPGGIITDIDIDHYTTAKVLKLDVQKDNYEYELKFNADSGEALSSQKEYNAKDKFILQNTVKNTNVADDTANSLSKTLLSVEKAKNIALQLAPGAIITDFELDYEHGMAIYEGEMRKGFMEYEFEIDAVTGTVLEWSSEYDD